ncbi:hypothetical protein QW180_01700 [Vibrio sinaloensis]|nr:hypothetical protein [Vibrio sinaloensis]
MEILTLDQLPQGGFCRFERKKQVVTDDRVFGARKHPKKHQTALAIFVYLADANFVPYGETGMHPHREIDVISVMAKGRVSHKGSLEHGKRTGRWRSASSTSGWRRFCSQRNEP